VASSKEIVFNAVKTLQADGLLGRVHVDSGENLTISCPFVKNHGGRKEQNTPSFGIHKTSGKWNCFSCGEKGGSIHTLFSRLKGLTALQTEYTLGTPREDANSVLAALQGLREPMPVPEPMTELPAVVPIGQHKGALDYMVRRGIPAELLEKCGVGYYGEERMPRKLGGDENFVRGKRVIFGIYHDGILCGYSARTMGQDEPKYYRPVKNVNLTLYDPLNICRSHDNSYVVVCEGEISALAALREGLPAVCSFGANISEAQQALLNRFQTVVMLYDGDDAGAKGVRGAVDAYHTFARFRPIILPAKQDPASLAPGWGDKLKKKVFAVKEDPTLANMEDLLRR